MTLPLFATQVTSQPSVAGGRTHELKGLRRAALTIR
jgi:hypothetical protein